ncbi:undecaprenyldiphospho-muramoylpentapeptide beta-N-acetylglucosaminyltransferase [Paenibacillus sp. GSMTC-2017]|uniref:undecaprenyldiphospho-muramoylpentapeptide beta-N-acetylglucosaminyltransferase n=1 Tax=Paenibacillus sp. GSMTC-2017 TaxID=2794350 RepID=UPI0018D65478|nr:undecaprenyldiphospho-muramoylpentapeptide beta-N-acetylglucosaminyltransferase [Paenibacillus sp. GSMTC-2017]MBH5317554.1 undecaprenyldiphospho-muramoylpentapeptide beta-N-acetylglucosaminyltransferase [Paenibacillus sp. GSMTC-2017]
MGTILFTGGGSAGHVTVNLALIPRFVEKGWNVDYIGSVNGIEKQLIEAVPNVRYFPISTGKLRRYMDWNNVKDPFRVVKGLYQAYRIINKQKPNVIFSKGGFVSVPVVLGAWLNKVPVLIHESDLTPGLANRIAIPFATGVCTTFPETVDALPENKCRYIGPIVREDLIKGNAEKGRALCGFNRAKPVMLIMGGSLGAKRINEVVRKALPRLLETYQVVHLCGKNGHVSSMSSGHYKQFEYVTDELPHLLAMTDIVISRAGSNSIFEFLALHKPMLLIPLPKGQSRGDQILNAESFRRSGYCDVLYEENLEERTLVEHVQKLYENRQTYIDQMSVRKGSDSLTALCDWIDEIKRK